MSLPKYAYWNCQGLGHPIRMALAYNRVDYEAINYKVVNSIEGEKLDWPSNKFNLGLPLPNLPYYIDGDVKLTQGGAILRYLGRKFNQYGANDFEASQVDMLIDTSMDLRYGLAMASYVTPDVEQLKKDMMEKEGPKFKQISEILQSKKFLLGDSISVADFPIYHAMKFYFTLDEKIVSRFKNLMDYVERIDNIPEIKALWESDIGYKGLFFSPAAHWGASYKGEGVSKGRF